MGTFISIVICLALLFAVWKLKRKDGTPMFTNAFKWLSTALIAALIACSFYISKLAAFLGVAFLGYKVINGVLTAVAAWPYIKKLRKYVIEGAEEGEA